MSIIYILLSSNFSIFINMYIDHMYVALIVSIIKKQKIGLEWLVTKMGTIFLHI